jgi:cytochrome c-type biogenesis protein CcmH/NrfG
MHLSSEQISDLIDELAAGDDSALGLKDYRDAQDHLSVCAQCALRAAALQRAATKLRSLEGNVNSERSTACPEETTWLDVAAGLIGDERRHPLLDHAALCDYCGPLLREAIADLGIETSPTEEAMLAELPSATLVGRRDLAARMARAAEAVIRPVGGRIPPPEPWWKFLVTPAMHWRVAIAIAVIATSLGVWWLLTPHVPSADRLIAQAYSAKRTLEVRIPGASYAPVSAEKGEGATSQTSKPLLDAELEIIRGLKAYPGDPNWLQAKGRAELLGGDPQSAIKSLTTAVVRKPGDASIAVDLASAYFESGDFNRALDLLNQVLRAEPDNAIALFNRAVIYQRQAKWQEAIADWNRYLQLDSKSDWAQEARRKLQEIGSESPASRPTSRLLPRAGPSPSTSLSFAHDT